ncbi:MAG: hypothetical protein LUQ11_09510, partial [Methylococcaceae bacterium]|nr:hypothetical protein [Methylococcaceae bacterium]
LLSRYGRRDYNAPFQHRDTQFWTLGPHIEWEINPDAELLLGYHYELGDSADHKAIYFQDDTSYENHYVSAELKLELMDRLSAIFIVDYEKKFFTSDHIYDEHHGASEDLYQGEIELHYAVDKSTAVKIGWQHGSRKLSTEEQHIVNNNIWIGAQYAF